MLDYDTWVMVKEECQNDEQVSFQRMGITAQNTIKTLVTNGEPIEVLFRSGQWLPLPVAELCAGYIYRVSPSWTGPAKPEPKPEYVDQPVVVTGGYRFAQPGKDDAPWLIAVAPGLIGFCGYVYEINGKEKIRPRLLFDQQPDGTYRLRVPKAVRFLKGAVA